MSPRTYIAVVWLNHKAAFQRIKAMTRGVHWANLGVLFSTALLPWPTALVSEGIAEGNPPDDRVAVGLYALIGAMLWVSGMIFFHVVLFRHPELLEDSVEETFFHGERLRAFAMALLYATAGLIGVLTIPALALAISYFYRSSTASRAMVRPSCKSSGAACRPNNEVPSALDLVSQTAPGHRTVRMDASEQATVPRSRELG
ncbi:TMEM175 family protein [Streptomyces sp. NPDC055105]|uniref:TMEM175 family protein n=1 Tax=Streptomyces sp. NPDC055105 TaxID=3365719 RepID=UPI0037D01931